MIGFCIGNGNGRKDFDLNKLKDKGVIIGCNALYRSFTPDYLTVVDTAMGKEISESGYVGNLVLQKPGLINSKFKGKIYLHKPKFRGNSRTSGGLATDFAVELGCTTIYWIGYDNPKSTPFQKASIYAGSKNYQRNSSWGYNAFMNEYKDIMRFLEGKGVYLINVIKEGISNPMTSETELGNFSNYSTITYEQFEKALDPCSSVDLEHAATDRGVEGSNPSRGTTP